MAPPPLPLCLLKPALHQQDQPAWPAAPPFLLWTFCLNLDYYALLSEGQGINWRDPGNFTPNLTPLKGEGITRNFKQLGNWATVHQVRPYRKNIPSNAAQFKEKP